MASFKFPAYRQAESTEEDQQMVTSALDIRVGAAWVRMGRRGISMRRRSGRNGWDYRDSWRQNFKPFPQGSWHQ
jgi:hypothetical protein